MTMRLLMTSLQNSKLLTYLICIAVLITFQFVAGCTSDDDSSRKPISASDAEKKDAPDFTVKTIDGEEITLSDYEGKKAVLVDLWGTWCTPCKMEMPELQKFYEAHSDEVEIIAAAQKDNLKNVQNYVNKEKITFKIVLDSNGTVAQKYKSKGIPFLVVINMEGEIVKTFTGYKPGLGGMIEKILDL